MKSISGFKYRLSKMADRMVVCRTIQARTPSVGEYLGSEFLLTSGLGEVKQTRLCTHVPSQDTPAHHCTPHSHTLKTACVALPLSTVQPSAFPFVLIETCQDRCSKLCTYFFLRARQALVSRQAILSPASLCKLIFKHPKNNIAFSSPRTPSSY